MTRRPGVKRIDVTDIADGARRVELRCGCAKAGMVGSQWESLDEAIDTLRARHRDAAPLCRHLEPIESLVELGMGRTSRAVPLRSVPTAKAIGPSVTHQ